MSAAKAYEAQFAFNTTSQDQRLAFFSIDVDDAPAVFNELKLDSVPHFYILPPAADKAPKTKISTREVEAKAFMDNLEGALKAIEASTSVKIRILLDPWPFVAGIVFAAILLAFVVEKASRDLWGTFLWYRSPILIACVSAVSVRSFSIWIYPLIC